jgi:hypothetical protein
MKVYLIAFVFLIALFFVSDVSAVNYVGNIPYACEDTNTEYPPFEVHLYHLKDIEWIAKPDFASFFNGISTKARDKPFNIYDDIGIPFRFKVAQIDGEPYCCAHQPRYCGYDDGYLESISYYLVAGNKEYPLNSGHGTGSGGNSILIDTDGNNIFDSSQNSRYVVQPPSRVPELSYGGYGWFGFNIYRDIGGLGVTPEQKEKMIEEIIEAINKDKNSLSFKYVASYTKADPSYPDVNPATSEIPLGEFTNCITLKSSQVPFENSVHFSTFRSSYDQNGLMKGEGYYVGVGTLRSATNALLYGLSSIQPFKRVYPNYVVEFDLGKDGGNCESDFYYSIIGNKDDDGANTHKYSSDINVYGDSIYDDSVYIHELGHALAGLDDTNLIDLRKFDELGFWPRLEETNCVWNVKDYFYEGFYYGDYFKECRYKDALRPSDLSIMQVYHVPGISSSIERMFDVVSCGHILSNFEGKGPSSAKEKWPYCYEEFSDDEIIKPSGICRDKEWNDFNTNAINYVEPQGDLINVEMDGTGIVGDSGLLHTSGVDGCIATIIYLPKSKRAGLAHMHFTEQNAETILRDLIAQLNPLPNEVPIGITIGGQIDRVKSHELQEDIEEGLFKHCSDHSSLWGENLADNSVRDVVFDVNQKKIYIKRDENGVLVKKAYEIVLN